MLNCRNKRILMFIIISYSNMYTVTRKSLDLFSLGIHIENRSRLILVTVSIFLAFQLLSFLFYKFSNITPSTPGCGGSDPSGRLSNFGFPRTRNPQLPRMAAGQKRLQTVGGACKRTAFSEFTETKRRYSSSFSISASSHSLQDFSMPNAAITCWKRACRLVHWSFGGGGMVTAHGYVYFGTDITFFQASLILKIVDFTNINQSIFSMTSCTHFSFYNQVFLRATFSGLHDSKLRLRIEVGWDAVYLSLFVAVQNVVYLVQITIST